jgi:hypothetical protein
LPAQGKAPRPASDLRRGEAGFGGLKEFPNAAIVVRSSAAQEPVLPTAGQCRPPVKRANGCPYDGRHRVVVPGVVHSPNDGLLRVMTMALQDEEHAGDGFEEVGAGVPTVAARGRRQAVCKGSRDLGASEAGQGRGSLWVDGERGRGTAARSPR